MTTVHAAKSATIAAVAGTAQSHEATPCFADRERLPASIADAGFLLYKLCYSNTVLSFIVTTLKVGPDVLA